MSEGMGRLSLRWVAAVGAASLLSAAVPATACINGSLPPEPRPRRPAVIALLGPEEQVIAQLIRAEEAVRLGNYWVGAGVLDSIRKEVELKASPRLKSRHARTSALISVRTGGRWPFWVAGSANNDAERRLVVHEARAALRKRLAEMPDDPIRMSDLGEALASSPYDRREARKMLEQLAAADLVTSAHAYAALGRLRADAGDRKGAAAAQAQCRRLDERVVACGSRAGA
jgi:hypothetical protein